MLRWFESLTEGMLENVKRRCGLKERRISARGGEQYLYPQTPNRATPNDSRSQVLDTGILIHQKCEQTQTESKRQSVSGIQK